MWQKLELRGWRASFLMTQLRPVRLRCGSFCMNKPKLVYVTSANVSLTITNFMEGLEVDSSPVPKKKKRKKEKRFGEDQGRLYHRGIIYILVE